MPQNLMIVESPNKIKKIKSFLGENWNVMASVGHVFDLAIKKGVDGLGIEDYQSFKPIYEITEDKKDVVNKLIKASKEASEVYLATDPDREGEAIAYHLKNLLKLGNNYKRVTFNEITEKAIKKSIDIPRKIDDKLIDAQETRRIIDRIFGFKGSNVIQRMSDGNLKSVGRVQSSGLKIVVDREREIQNFISTKYKEPVITINDLKFTLKMKREDIINTGFSKIEFPKQIEIKDINLKLENVNPPKPLTTNAALKVGSKLGFKPKEATKLLQTLFEKGKITYIRTDSNNVGEEFKDEAKSFISNNFDIKPDISRVYKNKEGAQEGHEAIRVTHLDDQGDDLTITSEKSLYEAIYKISLASQMESGKDKKQEITFKINDLIFSNTSKVVESLGFRSYYGYEEKSYSLSNLDKGTYNCNVELKEKATTAPPRYSQISFLEKLERTGIGRPSTFATILQTILERNYVETKNTQLIPSSEGFEVVEFLENHFKKFIDVEYTSNLENDLDQIHLGKMTKQERLYSFNNLLSNYLNQAQNQINTKLIQMNGSCPNCKSPLKKLTFKNGSTGKGCMNYPNCKYIEFDNNKTQKTKNLKKKTSSLANKLINKKRAN